MLSEILDTYITGVLKHVHPDLDLTEDAEDLVIEYLIPLESEFNTKIAAGSSSLNKLKAVVKKMLPAELAGYAQSEGEKYYNSHDQLLFKIEFAGTGQAGRYANAVLEYIAAEILELAGNEAMDKNQETITSAHIMTAIDKDPELKKYVKKSLELYKSLPKKTRARKAPRKVLRKGSRKASRKVSRKAPRKVSRKASRKASRKGSRKVSRKATGFAAMTVVDLKKEAKKRKLVGYSKLKKADLVKLLKSGKKGSVKKISRKKSDMTVVQLRALCKKNGIKGYSKLNKVQLLKKC